MLYNVFRVAVGNADIDYLCHNNRHDKLEYRFGKFAKRTYRDIQLEIFQVFRKSKQIIHSQVNFLTFKKIIPHVYVNVNGYSGNTFVKNY